MPCHLLLALGLGYFGTASGLSLQPHQDQAQAEGKPIYRRGAGTWAMGLPRKWEDWRTNLGAQMFGKRFQRLGQHGGKGEESARVWKALGPSTWMMFVDGCDHDKGPHAYNNTEVSMRNQQTGEHFDNARKVYAQFDLPEAWTDNRRWTRQGLSKIDIALKGPEAAEHHLTSAWWPRCGFSENKEWKTYGWYSECCKIDCAKFTNPEGDPLNDEIRKITYAYKEKALQGVLDRYYAAVDPIRTTCAFNCVNRALPHLADLFMGFAEVHYFTDANSRMRMLVLQTELVRLGGHPVVMADAGWRVYFTHSKAELMWVILQGWCNWEYVVRTGTSPFLSKTGAYQNLISYDSDDLSGECMSTPGQYNKHTGKKELNLASSTYTLGGSCGMGPVYRPGAYYDID